MAKTEAATRIGWVIRSMEREARKRDAVVFRAENATKDSPFKILVFTMLSARTKDETTMKAVERLFKLADTPKKISALGYTRLEKILYGVGFYRVKSRNLLKICDAIGEGKIPGTLDGLLKLPGIGRKTANIVLARAFGKRTLGVDVHVHRISNRLGLVRTRKPQGTEENLVAIIPSKYLPELNRSFVAFGQTVCLPRKPMCGICPLNQVCRRVGVKDPCPDCRYGSRG